MLRPIKTLTLGDVHCCHSQTRTEDIKNEIIHYLPTGEEASRIDILTIEGDFWDKLMPNNHPDVYVTKSIISYILRWCKQYDVILLLVDGTPLHDAGQMQWFLHINIETNINAKVRFFDEVTVDYIEELDMHVLYVPDRPRETPEALWEMAKEALRKANVEKVDMAIMHGCFQYQIPQISSDHKHIEENYLSIVTGPIFIGHVHKHSTFDRIIACGSFSRLSHGEEEPKGMVETIIEPDGTFRAKFIENKLATIYKTLDLTHYSDEEAMTLIKETASQLKSGSKLRLVVPINHPIATDKTFFNLKKEYLHLSWSIKVLHDEETVAKTLPTEETEEYRPLLIDNSNILDLVREKALSKGYPSSTVDNVAICLAEII